MGLGDLPDASLSIDSVEAAEEAVAVAHENRVVVFGVEDARSCRLTAWHTSEDALVVREVPHLEGTGLIDGGKGVAVGAEADIVDGEDVGIGVQKEAEVVGEDAVHLTALRTNDKLVLVVGKVHSHDRGVKLSFVRQRPLSTRHANLLDLAITATNEQVVA